MMSRWPSPAKLNLFLYITGQRADGYHTLQTLFQFLDYGDTLTIEPRADGELRLLTPVAGEQPQDRTGQPEGPDRDSGAAPASRHTTIALTINSVAHRKAVVTRTFRIAEQIPHL